MNRQHFIFFILYVYDNHNEPTEEDAQDEDVPQDAEDAPQEAARPLLAPQAVCACVISCSNLRKNRHTVFLVWHPHVHILVD